MMMIRDNQRCSANVCLDLGAVPEEDRGVVRAPLYLRFLVCFVFPLLYMAAFAARYLDLGARLGESIWPSENTTWVDETGKQWPILEGAYCSGSGYAYTDRISGQFGLSLAECLARCRDESTCAFATFGRWEQGLYPIFGGHFNEYRCQLYQSCKSKRWRNMKIYMSGRGNSEPSHCEETIQETLANLVPRNHTIALDNFKCASLPPFSDLLPLAINLIAMALRQGVFICSLLLAGWSGYSCVVYKNSVDPVLLGLVVCEVVNAVVLLYMHCKLVVRARDVQMGDHKRKRIYVPPVLAETGPVKPSSGSVKGGRYIRYDGVGEPVDIYINGRATGAIAGGEFVVPALLASADDLGDEGVTKVDVKAVMADGTECQYPEAFSYWMPGNILRIEPEKGPVTGNREVLIETSNLGASISEVFLGSVPCDFAEEPCNTEAIIYLPAKEVAGDVQLCVKSGNGNSAILESCFTYYLPDCFGLVGDRIELSNEGRTARRAEGMNRGVCIGSYPAKKVVGRGVYFEVVVTDMCPSRSTISVGFMAGQPGAGLVYNGRLSTKVLTATELKRVWLAGYDKGGAEFHNDGNVSKIPTSSWRPARSLQVGSRIGVLWEMSEAPHMVVFQDGEEKVRLKAAGDLPKASEDLFVVVDVQGAVRSVALLEGAQPPS